MTMEQAQPLAAHLMGQLRSGDQVAAGGLVKLFYPELRRIAAAQMTGERANHTWRPTELVNELYLELRRIKSLPPGSANDDEERTAFLRLSSFLMRRLLIHHARPLARKISTLSITELRELPSNGEQGLAEIEQILNRLAAIDPVLRTVVEMKVFEGLTREEIAGQLHCSVRTVATHWRFAQEWLRSVIADWNAE
jgi:RNA polymerase sigma factor (TIGR02999 family)